MVAAVALGGCGGSGGTARPSGPRLPHALGERLAGRADAVAAALAQGSCSEARELARRLQRETIAAINARLVPPQLLEDLQVGVNVLVDDIRCPATATPTTPTTTAEDENEDQDEGPGHGKAKGHGKKGHGKKGHGKGEGAG